MTFKEYNLSIMKNSILSKLLPLECRKTYPVFSQEGDILYAAFIGFRINLVSSGIEVLPPSYYLKIRYPQCTIRSFVRIKNSKKKGHLMTAQTSDDILQLSLLCDQILEAYDSQSEELSKILVNYNTLLLQILEVEQKDVLNAFSRLEQME